MGSLAALSSRSAAPSLRDVLEASPARATGPLREVALGDWRIGVFGEDSWVFERPGWAAAVTGVVDDLPAGANPAEAVLSDIAPVRADVARRRGVFTAVVTNGRGLWAWRDHLGFSPLFVAGQPAPSAVATSARQALAGASLPIAPDLEMIETSFWGWPVSDTSTYFRRAVRIPKASLIHIEAGSSSVERYWDPLRLVETRRSSDHLAEEFARLLGQAARRALGPEPVVSLSGGIDAPAVAAFAAPAYRDLTGLPLPALSAVYPDLPAVDESEYIELVAARLGMTLDTYVPAAGPLRDIRELLAIAEGPVPTVSLAESAEYYSLARRRGHRTILTGEMAEFVMAMSSYTLRHLLWTGRWKETAGFLRADRNRGIKAGRVARNLAVSILPSLLADRWHRRGSSRPEDQVPWLDRSRRSGSPGARPGPDRWVRAQVAAFEGPGLSVEADEALQAAHGVRVRRPWLDVDLWEFFLSLPAAVKYPDSGYKSLAKKWLRGWVPDEILDRRDRTFFDDSFRRRLEIPLLRSLLAADSFRMPGVDYSLLDGRLDRPDLPLIELMWAKDLAVIHAFVGLYS